MGQIRVHVSAPGEIVVPDTGVLTQPTSTSYSGGNEKIYYTGLGIIVAIVLLAILPAFIIRRWKNKEYSKKKLMFRVLALAILSFGLTFAALSFSENRNRNAIASVNELTATADDVDIYVELQEEAVYKTVSSTITVDKSTDVGYTLSAFTTSTNLISTTSESDMIYGLVADEPVALSDNTWGISLTAPDSRDSTTWQAMPDTEQNAMMLKSTTNSTSAGDQTTVYYGVYISPDTPEGTYVTTINYKADPNLIMQEVDEWGDSVEEGQEVFAVDKRDGKRYSVTRLRDGHIWMTQNLAIDIPADEDGDGYADITFTHDDTDLGWGTDTDTITWTPIAGASSANEWANTQNLPRTYSVGNTDYTNIVEDYDPAAQAHLIRGNYYNWAAAIAVNSSSEITANNIDNIRANPQNSICPAGWRLPTISSDDETVPGSTNEFARLNYLYNDGKTDDDTALYSSPLFFAHAGIMYGTQRNFGVNGYYWSSTPNNGGYSYRLIFNANAVLTTDRAVRDGGYSIRCVARSRRTISDLTYMQDISTLSEKNKASVLASMEDNMTYNLIDNRDNKSYAIAKLKDGNIWMVDNLDLGRTELTTDLTSADTNISAAVTAAAFNSWKKTSGTGTFDAGEFINVSGSDATSGTAYGTLYNFYAASAGTITGSINSNDAEYDICPAGWRLPTGGSDGEFKALYDNYDTNTLLRTPITDGGASFALSGRFYTSTLAAVGSNGFYWSSTMANDSNMHVLLLTTTDVVPANSRTRASGFAIRCLVQ